MKWVSAYGASQCGNRMYRMNVAERTFRTFVKLPFGGEKVRLILSSMYGTKLFVGAMTITSAGQTKAVTLQGENAFTIRKNQRILSDELDLPVNDKEEVEIRTYFSKGVCMTGLWQRTTYSKTGNYTSGSFEESDEDIWLSKKRPFDIGIAFPLVSGIDVYTPYEDAKAVAVFGASNEFIGRWVNPLREKLEKEMPHTALLNVSISGNRLLRDTGNQLLLGNLFGDSGVKRFDWDVAGYAGVETFICCDGANDVHQPTTYACYPWEKIPTYDAFCEGFRALNRKARTLGIRCIGTSLTPLKNGLGYNDEKRVLRRKVNEWILASGEYDAVFDLAKVISDHSDPDAMNPSFDSGDHLHFNVEGGQAIADAFPLEILK